MVNTFNWACMAPLASKSALSTAVKSMPSTVNEATWSPGAVPSELPMPRVTDAAAKGPGA
jgi:hypothetical protein